MSAPTGPRAPRRRLAVKVNADSRFVVYPVVALVAGLIATNMVASFNGLLAVSAWARYPDALRWTTPVMLDGSIIVYSAALLVRRARGEGTRLAWAGIIGGTILSAAANAAHVVLAGTPADAAWVVGVGAAVASLAPVAGALALHQLTDLAIAGPDEEVAPRRRAARALSSAASQPVPALALATTLTTPTPARPVPARRVAPRVDADKDAVEAQVRELGDGGHSERQIAAQLSLSRSRVHRILTADQEGVLVPA